MIRALSLVPVKNAKGAVVGVRWADEAAVRESVVGDPLDTPPAPGQEKSWLQQVLDDAATKLSEARQWAQSQSDAMKAKAREALDALQAMLARVKAAAGDVAPELVQKAEQLAKDAGLVLGGLGLVVTSPLWLPLLLYLAYQAFK